jgi:hypothetical protein
MSKIPKMRQTRDELESGIKQSQVRFVFPSTRTGIGKAEKHSDNQRGKTLLVSVYQNPWQ